jgi:subtilisin family serine protease
MSKKGFIGLSALLVVILAASVTRASAPEATYKPDQLIVRFEPALTPAQQQAIVTSLGGCCIEHRFKMVSGLTVVQLAPGQTVQEAMRAFNQADGVIYAEPNYEYKYTATIPNDPRFTQLWGLHNTGQLHPVWGGPPAVGTPDADIDAPEAWDIRTNASSIIVAVIDTGVDYTHPDLAANMWVNPVEQPGDKNGDGRPGIAGVDDDGDGLIDEDSAGRQPGQPGYTNDLVNDDDENGYIDDIYGYDFVNGDGDPMDDMFHGTHCAGTIGAIGNNNIGVAGVCWGVRIMALKFLDAGGSGWTDDAIEAIEYAIDNGAKVLSNSWGSYGYSVALKDVIDAAGEAGVLFVAAAGNNALDNDLFPSYPASYNCPNIISVMATDHDDNRAVFSNYGAGTVDIGAPGQDITSTFPTTATEAMQLSGLHTNYETISGTSMACPHVSGAVALLWSAAPGLTHIQVKCRLLEWTDRKLPGLCVSGGRLNIYNALAMPARAPRVLTVPDLYPTIEDAMAAARDGDVIVVGQGIHFVEGIEGVCFNGKQVTVMSQDPEDPVVVANTIIDCRNHGRAFSFCCGEDENAIVSGFTIRNGHAAGAWGIGGLYPGEPTDPANPDSPPTARWGEWVWGDGKGGAIHCDNGSTPTISHCVITNCIASGAVGGNGLNGVYRPPGSSDPGQWGGDGGWAYGDGLGGAIYSGGGSNPRVSNCTFTNNKATGPIGGNGGNGSINEGSGSESSGGDGGRAFGDGYGGTVFVDANSTATIIDCTFSNNIAIHGTGGQGGRRGTGSSLTPPATDGFDGWFFGAGFGGGAYYASNANVDFTRVTISGNTAYEWYDEEFPEFAEYSYGGGIYCDANSLVAMVDCAIEANKGGGLYYGKNGVLTFTNCNFVGNQMAAIGGGLYVGRDSSVTAVNCAFSANTTPGDGGGIYSADTHLNLSDCTFSGNWADGDGGGIFSLGRLIVPTITVARCSFTGNSATYGGGVAWDTHPDAWVGFDATVTDSYFVDNTAQAGGGLFWANSSNTSSISGCLITGNSASGNYGGGAYLSGSSATLRDCTLVKNSVLGSAGSGGGINIFASSAVKVSNCLLSENFAVDKGSAISCNMLSSAEITLCTISKHTTPGKGGGLFCDKYSTATVRDCIFDNCRKHGIYEQGNWAGRGDVTPTYNLFYNNPDGDFFDEGTTSYTGAANINSHVAGAHHNKDGNPFYSVGPLGNFYLNQSISPAVDAGSDTAAHLGMDTYTTRTDSVPDAGQVDMGFHYRRVSTVPQYTLTTSVVPDEYGDAHGWVEPASGTYYAGTVATLTAHPDAGWKIKRWGGGTTNDSSLSTVNTVVMSFNKNITVQFEPGRVISVPRDYTDIQYAIDEAQDGDTIIVEPGVWEPGVGWDRYYLIDGKAITLTSTNPDDPATVAATIIRTGLILQNVERNTVIQGLTIRDFYYEGYPNPAANGEGTGADGHDGSPQYGGGIFLAGELWQVNDDSGYWFVIYEGVTTSPTVINCVFRNCGARGANGGNGSDGGAEVLGGDGGWGGWARGGGAYCGVGSNPLFVNCKFIGCEAIGGSGGNGGNAQDPMYGGRGGSWESNIGDNEWGGWTYGPYKHYWKYSGYGGGVYVDANSTAEFINCEVANCRSEGGLSGINGTPYTGLYPQPQHNYDIENFGGAVYCAANSRPKFTKCLFRNNSADTEFAGDWVWKPYISYGGGVCVEEEAEAVFKECLFSNNQASIGGGLYIDDGSIARIVDCNFTENIAMEGGGIDAIDSFATIIGTLITGNRATQLNGVGGGIYCEKTPAWIADSIIQNNRTEGSGGGLYFRGGGYQSFALKLDNCLIVNNTSIRDGGGVSCNWFAEPAITNCTVSGNKAQGDLATGAGGYGGGLYCGYNSNAIAANSIFWGNSGPNTITVGREIWVGSIDPNSTYVGPSALAISYSDVQGGQAKVHVDPGCTLTWGAGNLAGTGSTSDPLFAEGYFLSQPATGEPNQTQPSPCVNTGSGSASELPLGRYRYTTRTDNGNDIDPVDMSFHYCKRGEFVPGDINYSSEVNFDDLLLMLEHWLEEDCVFPDWCEGADINEDGTVNNIDYSILTQLFGLGDTTAPVPNPSTWEVPPVSRQLGAVYMRATLSADNSGTAVQYYFQCTKGADKGGKNSGWRYGREYEDTGLQGGAEYAYRVKARDQRGNETAWSVTGYAAVGEDRTPPRPDPSEWLTQPYSTSHTTIRMVAETATDASGVEYYFTCTYGAALGGSDSGWQNSSEYEDIGLQPDTMYCYRVRTRDKSSNHNQTIESDDACATTLSEPDIDPPAPLGWNEVPREYWGGDGYYHRMSAVVATDASGVVLYYFKALCGAAKSSGWQTSPVYNYLVSYTGSVPCCYKVGLRDAYGNTVWMSDSQIRCTQ